MGRSCGSLFASHLPPFKKERVACYNWGLASGKIQTIYPWEPPPGTPEPPQWFHDIFHADGRPFNPEEVRLIKQLAARGKV